MAPASIYQIKVTLKGSRPPIWRRFQVPGDVTLLQLHYILQAIMGWGNAHLHSFTVDRQVFGDPADDEFGYMGTRSEKRYRLNQVAPEAGDRLTYEYDFGDSWEHSLLVEKILPPEEGVQYPICLKGKRACPPEDVGGVWGYEGFLEAYFDPANSEHQDAVEWLGEGYDPEAFDLEQVNAELSGMTTARQGENPPEQEEVEIVDAFDFFDEDDDEFDEDEEEEYFWTSPWGEQPPEEFSQLAENLAIRKDAVALLTYIQDHRVVGTSSTGNFPLKVVRELVDRMGLPQRAGGELPKFRSEEEVWPLYYLHLLAASSGLIDGGVSEPWVLTDLGEMFLESTALDQVSHLVFNWYLDTQGMQAFPDEIISEMPVNTLTIDLDSILQAPIQEPLALDVLIPQIIGMPQKGWQEIQATERGALMRMSILMMVFIPMASFGMVEPEFTTGEAGEHEIISVQLTSFGQQLLQAVVADTEEDE